MATLFALETWCDLWPVFHLVVGLKTGRRMRLMSFFRPFERGMVWVARFCCLGFTGRLAVNVRPLSTNQSQTLTWQKRLSTSRTSVIGHSFSRLWFSSVSSFCARSQFFQIADSALRSCALSELLRSEACDTFCFFFLVTRPRPSFSYHLDCVRCFPAKRFSQAIL